MMNVSLFKKILPLSIAGGLLMAGGSHAVLSPIPRDKENPAIFSTEIGTIRVSLLQDGEQPLDSKVLITDNPEIKNAIWAGAMNCYLLQTRNHNILIDTGMGKKIASNLKTLAVDPEKIDIILITHMHGDHIGGLLDAGQARFPNATIYIAKPEYEHWVDPESAFRENIAGRRALPDQVAYSYKNKIKLFTPGELGAKVEDLIPGVKAIAAFGHTPGHTMFLVESGGQKSLFWGDIVHAFELQITQPEISVTYDNDPEMAAKTRLAVLNYAAKNNIPVWGMHIPFPGELIIRKKDDGFNYVKVDVID